MRHFIAIFICGLLAVSALAQRGPVGMRIECAEASENDNEFSLFSYRDPDGTFGYYLSVGAVFHILEVFRDESSDVSFDHVDEVCVRLGGSRAEVSETLGRMLSWYDADLGTVFPMEARQSHSGGALGAPVTADCILVKRILHGKRLCFNFVSGSHTARVDLSKSCVKTLKRLFEMDGRIQAEVE